jgi:hypothetical protein
VSHRVIALLVIMAALVIDAALGLAFAAAEQLPLPHGLFCGLANAVTDGCDVAPRTVPGYVITAAEYILVVPLFAATFSLFTSGLTAVHIKDSEARVKQHIENRLRHHLGRDGGSP